MNKTEWHAQRHAYRAYLRACAERQVRVWMADSPSHAALNDPRPAYVERPFGYSAPYDVMLQFGWRSWTIARIGKLVRKHQDELGVTPVPLSPYSVDETKQRRYTLRLIEAVYERQLFEIGAVPRECVGHTHHHQQRKAA